MTESIERTTAEAGALVEVGNSNRQYTAAGAYLAAYIRECEAGSEPYCVMFTPMQFAKLPRLHMPFCADLSRMERGVMYPMSPVGRGASREDKVVHYALRLSRENGEADEYVRVTRRQMEDARHVCRMNPNDAPRLAGKEGR